MRRILLGSLCLFVAPYSHAGDQAGRIGQFTVLCSSNFFTGVSGTNATCILKSPILPGETVIAITGTNGSGVMNQPPNDVSGNSWKIDQSSDSGTTCSLSIAHMNANYFVAAGTTYTFTQSVAAVARAVAMVKLVGIYNADIDTTSQITVATAISAWSSGPMKGTQSDGIIIGGSLNAGIGSCASSTPTGGQTQLANLGNLDNDCFTAQMLPVFSAGVNSLSGTWDGNALTMRSGAVQYRAEGRRID